MELPAPSCGSKRSISGRADEGRSLPAALIGAAANRGRSHQAVESASAVHDANHLDALGQKPIEDQVVADRKVLEVRGNVRTCTAEVGMRGEPGAGALQRLKQTVGGLRVVLSVTSQ